MSRALRMTVSAAAAIALLAGCSTAPAADMPYANSKVAAASSRSG